MLIFNLPKHFTTYYGLNYVSLFQVASSLPWIQQQFKRLTYSRIFRSMLIFNLPKHFTTYYALVFRCLGIRRKPFLITFSSMES
ncbi:hypothetical protein Goarm_006554 [Gossypium armourianum]|uniref:Uncharacterized protein n=1 Tax=Gossypium armourianum TaxID=34283 RepID=A0A7J9JJV2_9ROSI|nr:hypothetical protein [Gossypium armourianum]